MPDARHIGWYDHIRDRMQCRGEHRGYMIGANMLRYRNISYSVAIVERKMPNIRHSVTDFHTRKTATAGECRNPDTRHAVGNGHVYQSATVRERTIPNAFNAAGDRHAR